MTRGWQQVAQRTSRSPRTPSIRTNQRTTGLCRRFPVVWTTFTTPLAYPSFLWLMASRLLILMGIVGIQSFAFFFFSDTFFRGDTRATTTATTVLVGLVV